MTLAQDITRHFGGSWHGSYGAIPTPGHGKADRGTTVKDGASGGVVFNSFNGGDWREIKQACEQAGLIEPFRAAEPLGGERETGRYEFRDEKGVVLYRTRRLEKPGARKRFIAERPDGRGGWTPKLGDVRRVLYRLPELSKEIGAATIRDGAMPLVYLVEGERKADKLAGWGLLATAIAFGARGGIGRPEYTDALRGCRVVILPDNDAEGRAFAEAARAVLSKVGCEIVVLALPGLPEKGDVIDWSGTADDLRALTDAALNPPVATFPIADLAAWAQTPPEPKAFTMAGFIPTGEVTLFTGAGGTNKSTFGLQLCAASAVGKPMLGADVAPGPALYVTAEDEDRENHWRLLKMAHAIGTSLDRLAGKLSVVSLRGRLNNELATYDGEGRLHAAPAFKMLRATIDATGARLVVLDNVAHLYVGNENDRGQVTTFVNLLYQLCRDLGCTVVLIGHPNKIGDSYSGSTAWLNAVRSQIVLGKPENATDPDARLLTLGKANYSRADQQLLFRWHDFALVRDADLSANVRDELTANAVASGDNAIFLTCLEARTRDGLTVSPNVSPNYAPAQFEAMPAAKGIGKVRLRAAMERLLAIGAVEICDYENKSKGRSIKALRVVSRTSPDGFPDASRTVPGRTPERIPDATRTTPHIHLPLKGEPGAGLGAAAPVQETRQRGAPILAAEDLEDGGAGGLEGWPS